MAALLEKYLTGEYTSPDIISFLQGSTLRKGDESSPLNALRTEFVPFCLNNLRDQTSHLMQGCRSTTTTPAKTPLSAKLNRSTKSSKLGDEGPQKGRVQLFNADSSSNNHQMFNLSGNSEGSFSAPKKSNGNRSSSYSETPRSQRSIVFAPHGNGEPHSHQKKTRPNQSLGDFITPADNDSRKKRRNSHSKIEDGVTPSHSRKRSGGKRNGARNKGKESAVVPQPPPDFSLEDEFPSLENSTSSFPTTPVNDANIILPAGAQMITPARRVVTTTPPSNQHMTCSTPNAWGKLRSVNALVSPSPGTIIIEEDRNLPKEMKQKRQSFPPEVKDVKGQISAGCLKSGDARSPALLPVAYDANSNELAAKQNLSNFSTEEIQSTPVKCRLLNGISEELQASTQVSPIKNVLTPVKEVPSPLKTPTKAILERMISEITKADVSKVTQKEALCLYAELYSNLIKDSLVLNVCVELYFITQMLVISGSGEQDAASLQVTSDPDEMQLFPTVHNAVFFAVEVLSQLSSLLPLLDRTTLRKLADNQRIADFSPCLKQKIEDMLTNYPSKGIPRMHSPPIGSVSFQADTDNRKNFPTEHTFHVFKKQRDQFYELIREWEAEHLKNGWSMHESQSEKIWSLVTQNTDLANYLHFSRLFMSQLIEMCKCDGTIKGDSDVDNLLSSLKQAFPGKLKMLQHRFESTTKPEKGPCPRPSFPGCQEFFRDFIMIAANPILNQHLSNVITARLEDLNNTEFMATETLPEDESNIDNAERELLLNCLITSKLLGKFLGLLHHLPYSTVHSLPDSLTSQYLAMRMKVPLPLDVLNMLRTAFSQGRLVITLPWMVEYLSQIDVLAPKLPAVQAIFNELLSVHVYVNCSWRERPTHASLMVMLLLGWLYEMPIFPDEMLYQVRKPPDVVKPSVPNLDASDIVDSEILYTCCPYLSEIGHLLTEFAAGTNPKHNNARRMKLKLLHKTEKTSEQTACQRIEHQLEECFFRNHGFLKHPIDFFAKQLYKRYVANIRNTVKVKAIESALPKVRDLANKVFKEAPISRKKRGDDEVEKMAVSMAATIKMQDRENLHSMCHKEVMETLPKLLDRENPGGNVMKTACDLCTRNARDKITVWLNENVTARMFSGDLHTEYDRTYTRLVREHLLKSTENSNPNCEIIKHTFTENTVINLKPTLQTFPTAENHEESFQHPSEFMQQFMRFVASCMGDDPPTEDTVLEELYRLEELFCKRQDMTPGLARSLGKLSVEMAYWLITKHPHLYSPQLQSKFNNMWLTYFAECVSFDRVVCVKHIFVMNHSEDPKASWACFTAFVIFLLQSRYLDVTSLAKSCEDLQKRSKEIPEEAFNDLVSFMCILAEEVHLLPDSEDPNKELMVSVIDWLNGLPSHLDRESRILLGTCLATIKPKKCTSKGELCSTDLICSSDKLKK